MTKKNKNNNFTKSNTLWGGRFNKNPTEILQNINSSIDIDKRLFKQDIAGSIAHCEMLVSQGIINETDGTKIINGLKTIENEIISNNFKFKKEFEDIHLNIENRLHELIGDSAGKLHTGRSRNDQVATDFRLWVRDAINQILDSMNQLQKNLIDQAEKNYKTIMPGLTHLQNAQPITFGHHLLAYVEMFHRDISRFKSCQQRSNESPLGSGALAGTTFDIDRDQTSKKLGFNNPMRNSLDAVSSRDFAIEFLSSASMCSINLSRIAEEIILWTSEQFKFVKLSDEYTTGSSMMPQKRNPDAAELIRAKSGRIIGNLNSLMIVMKGLPLAYSKDLQEDKEPVFDTFDNLILSISAMSGMIKDLTANSDKMYKANESGFITATDLADWLVINIGIPFRESHFITGKIVKLAEEMNCSLYQIPIQELKNIEPRITDKIYNALEINSSLNSRTSFGGTAPKLVLNAINKYKEIYL
ncbi:argininosuccinate lyase [Alphaproteobacteria bacterium]|nr:argininosuccinate lyase [Alphaproteobacteria bacterium]